jgi:hypothetical protein
MTRAYAAFEAAGAYWFTELTVMNPPRGRILRSRFTQNRQCAFRAVSGVKMCIGLKSTVQQSASLNTSRPPVSDPARGSGVSIPGELNVVPVVFLGVSYSQERGVHGQK